METLSCSLSLVFLAEVTGRGYQREGFSGFLRAITATERAIARSVDCECPISAATSVRSSSVSAIALRLGNSLPYRHSWFPARSLHLIRTIGSEYLSHSTVYIACRASESRYALGPYNTVDPFSAMEPPSQRLLMLSKKKISLPADRQFGDSNVT